MTSWEDFEKKRYREQLAHEKLEPNCVCYACVRGREDVKNYAEMNEKIRLFHLEVERELERVDRVRWTTPK